MQFADVPAQFKYTFDTPYVNPIELETGHIAA